MSSPVQWVHRSPMGQQDSSVVLPDMTHPGSSGSTPHSPHAKLVPSNKPIMPVSRWSRLGHEKAFPTPVLRERYINAIQAHKVMTFEAASSTKDLLESQFISTSCAPTPNTMIPWEGWAHLQYNIPSGERLPACSPERVPMCQNSPPPNYGSAS